MRVKIKVRTELILIKRNMNTVNFFNYLMINIGTGKADIYPLSNVYTRDS